MGRARIVDPDTERPPDVAGLPVLDRVVAAGESGSLSAVSAAGAASPARPGDAAHASSARDAQAGDDVRVDADRVDAELCLPFELRARSRLRARLSSGA